MKEVLDDFGEDKVKLEQLLSGRRVKLAEDLSEFALYLHLCLFYAILYRLEYY